MRTTSTTWWSAVSSHPAFPSPFQHIRLEWWVGITEQVHATCSKPWHERCGGRIHLSGTVTTRGDRPHSYGRCIVRLLSSSADTKPRAVSIYKCSRKKHAPAWKIAGTRRAHLPKITHRRESSVYSLTGPGSLGPLRWQASIYCRHPAQSARAAAGGCRGSE